MRSKKSTSKTKKLTRQQCDEKLKKICWDSFYETGEIGCYLLYKEICGEHKEDECGKNDT